MRKSLAAGAVLLMCALSACGGGSGGSDAATSADKPSSGKDTAASFDPCKDISAAEAEAVLGFPVTVKEVPGGGCSWGSEENPRLASLSVGEAQESGGGIESSKVGTQSQLEGEPQDVAGVGDAAYVVVGKGKQFATTQFQAQGAIETNGKLILVGITQLGDSPEDEVRAQAEAGLKLVGSKL